MNKSIATSLHSSSLLKEIKEGRKEGRKEGSLKKTTRLGER